MYVRPQHKFMRRVFNGSAVMRRFAACVAWTATPAPFSMLRPAMTVRTRRCHILTSNQSAQGGTNSDATCSPGHPPPPQPHSLLAQNEAVTRAVLELWPHVCNEVIDKYETSAGPLMMTTSKFGSKDIVRSATFVEEVHKGAAKFDISEGGFSLVSKESSGAAMMTACVEGVLIVFVHPSVAAVDSSRAPSIQSTSISTDAAPHAQPPAPDDSPRAAAAEVDESNAPPIQQTPTSVAVDLRRAPFIESISPPPSPPGAIAKPPWRIYGITDFTADKQAVIKAFQFALNGGHEAPRVLVVKFPDDRKLEVWANGKSVTVHVAASDTDWVNFKVRQCDFLHSGMKESARAVPEGGRSLSGSKCQPVFFDLAVAPAETSQTKAHTERQEPVPAPIYFTIDPNKVQLIGGEAGIGKTTVMLVGRCNDVGLVVYVCASTKPEVVQWDDDFVKRLKVSGFHDSTERDAVRRKLIELLAKLVEGAVGKELHGSLCAYEGAFRVRLVFDEVGSLGEVVRALCAQGSAVFHKLLRWGPEVSVYVVAGGTGVGAADAPSASQLERYSLTRLRPSSSGVLWNEMKKKVKETAATLSNLPFSTALDNVLQRVDADAVCQSVRGNPRLAALMIVRCWNMATVTANCHIVQQVNDVDIRFRILVPVAAQFQSLNGLNKIQGYEAFRDMLVSALGYALFPGFRDHDSRHHRDTMVQKYGVLVDNTYYKLKEEFDPNSESMVFDDGGNIVQNTSTKEVACYPTAKGHYSISPAMVAVLYLLLVGNSEQFIKCEGDSFEVAVAHMLYIAVQVYQGRPVAELLRFVFGENVVSSSIIASLKGKTVTYTTVELRHNQDFVNVDVVAPLLENNATKLAKNNATKLAKSNATKLAKNNATKLAKNNATKPLPDPRLTSFRSLWSAKAKTAWIEISPVKLPSADVVLQIPGVLTLPIQCKDRSDALPRHKVHEELDKMVRRVENPVSQAEGPTEQQAKDPTEQQGKKKVQTVCNMIFVDKLAELGDVVVPVLCYSRSVLNADHRRSTSDLHNFNRVIFADGLGEDVAKGTVPCLGDETRLVRRSMLPFTLKELQGKGKVTVIDSSPKRDPPATYVTKQKILPRDR